jgi:hypothetical protein
MKSNKQTRLITGVHNYCDRWCERCPFTQRCAVGIEGNKVTDAQKDMENEAFWRTLSQNFTKTIQFLQEGAKKHGIDLTPPTTEELLEFERKDAEKRAILSQTPLIEATNSYVKQTIQWFKVYDKTFEEHGFELIQHIDMGIKTEEEMLQQGILFGESIEVIQWYMHFISVKFSRAFHGKLEDDGWEAANGFPKDSDGSAKVALIAAERSLAAWAQLAALMPDFADSMLPMLANLQKIIRLGDIEFPDARYFVRAGFDD